jgi:serine/threonine-protein kinase
VVHRDVKPDNVLLDDESGRALLTDFGVAKALGRSETLTAVGSVVGTPSYMSPEQAAGRADIDGRSDIYSLGVMAYAMLTGRLPFEGKTAADVLTKRRPCARWPPRCPTPPCLPWSVAWPRIRPAAGRTRAR